MDRNPDFDTVREIALNSTEESDANLYKFAPLTSVDVERSFSTYKWLLNVKRNRLKIENLEKVMIIYFNSVNVSEADNDFDISASCSQQLEEEMSTSMN